MAPRRRRAKGAKRVSSKYCGEGEEGGKGVKG